MNTDNEYGIIGSDEILIDTRRNAIDHFNEKNQDDIEVDTVDLSSKFDSIYDYVDDYID